MKQLTKEQLEQLKSKVSVIRGIYKTLQDERFKYAVPAGVLRRYNTYLDKINQITNDDEFINFSVSIMTSWSNDYTVDNTDLNFKINQFLEYLNTVYNVESRDIFKKLFSKSREWIIAHLKEIIIGIIITVIGGLILSFIL